MENDDLHKIEAAQRRVDELQRRATTGQAQGASALPEAVEELQSALEELQVAEEELRQQNEELSATRQAVEAERQRYQELFDFAPDGYLVTDAHGTIQEANRAAAVLLAVSQDFLVDKPLIVFVAGDERRAFHDQLARLAQQGQVQDWELRLQPRERDPFPAALTVASVRDPQSELVGLRWSIRDITARVRAEAALQRRNHELALLNRTVQVLGASLDLDQVLATILEEMRHLLGVTAGSVWLADPATGELVCCQAAGPQRAIVRGWRLAPGQGIAGWVTQHGQSLIVPDAQADARHFADVDRQTGLAMHAVLSVPLRIKEKVLGALQVLDTEADRFSVTDLSLLESLAATAAMAVENAQLYAQARADAEALRCLNAELETQNADLDAFAHTVAHELQGQLTGLVGYAEMLKIDYAAVMDPEGVSYLQKLAQFGRKIGNITDELLLLAELRAVEVPIEPLNMAFLVAEAQKRLVYLIQESQAEIIVPPAGTWPETVGYGPWVEEVWVNYLSNAIKYGGQPPRVERGASPRHSPPGGGNAGGMVRFWVRDNGPGISPEDQARLFAPFVRLNKVRAKGHGLGLSISHRIVAKLGGQVGVESQLEQGSVFTFTLPTVESWINERTGGDDDHFPSYPIPNTCTCAET
jgi:PAS domain S-box-containing protein